MDVYVAAYTNQDLKKNRVTMRVEGVFRTMGGAREAFHDALDKEQFASPTGRAATPLPADPRCADRPARGGGLPGAVVHPRRPPGHRGPGEVLLLLGGLDLLDDVHVEEVEGRPAGR